MTTKPAIVKTPPPKNEAKPSVLKLLEEQKTQIAMALPKHMNPNRMLRIITTECRRNPKLMECEPISFLGAVIQAAQLGLEPGNGLGHAYLIPFWNSKKNCREVQFMPGYRGLIDLARRSGQIVSISARCVYANDYFKYSYGTNEFIEHEPNQDDPGDMICAYAVAKLKDGGVQMEVMSRLQIEKIRDNGNDNPVWKDHFDEMSRKTLVRRIFKYLPVSVEMQDAMNASDKVDSGEAQDTAKTLIDVGVSWTEPTTTPQEIDAGLTADLRENQRLEVFDRVEKKIAEHFKAKGNTGDTILALEKAIGMAVSHIEKAPIDRLLAVFEIVKQL